MKIFNRLLSATALLLMLISNVSAQYDEKYRSQYHFSPNSGWIGDPDGLVKYHNVYHLFWWGHATSTDLVHWTQLPYPIQGDPGVGFSVNTGSAVIDKNNIAGFGKGKMIGFHTIDRGNPRAQGVGLSVSTDTSSYNTLQLYSGNPILGNFNDFRDPQVFWHAATSKWIMLVALGAQRKIAFYTSTDMKTWAHVSDFGPAGGATSDNWETPDLVQLPVDGNTSNMKWVLINGVYPVSDTVRQQYFIGSFNGTTFTNETGPILADYGRDFYAARTWRDYDNTQTSATILGWMGNWSYAQIAPSQNTYKGKGVMSLPRTLSLKTYPEGVRLTQTPIAGLSSLRKTGVSFNNKSVSGTNNITAYGSFSPSQNVYEFDATFSVNPSATFGFNLCVNNSIGKKLILKYEGPTSKLTIDRSNCSDDPMNSYFQKPMSAIVPPDANNNLRLHVYIDQSSVEVFANDGKIVMSMLTYPGTNQSGIEVFSQGGTTALTSFNGWELNSIWSAGQGYKIRSGSTYQIKARHDGKVMDSPSEAPGNGTQLQQWDVVGGPNQLWKVDSVDLTRYRLTNVGTNKVADLTTGSAADGNKIQQWDWENNDNQKWQIADLGGEYYSITAGNGSVVEVEGGATANGHGLQQWRFLGYPHQEWKFELVNPAISSRIQRSPQVTTAEKKPSHSSIYPNAVTYRVGAH